MMQTNKKSQNFNEKIPLDLLEFFLKGWYHKIDKTQNKTSPQGHNINVRKLYYNWEASYTEWHVFLSAFCYSFWLIIVWLIPFSILIYSSVVLNDRDGNVQNFWAGNNETRIHTQCLINRNCVDPTLKCKCDTGAPVKLVDDDGLI
jgi:hypothetical protein